MINLEDRAAVLEEVRLIVVEALREGGSVRLQSLANVIARSYPDSGISEAEIAEAIRQAFIVARVPIAAELLSPHFLKPGRHK